jgi:hypothetical protein
VSQTWTLNQEQAQQIQTCKMRCYRKITNNTIRYKIHMATIKEKVGIKPCMQYIEKQRMKWFGHLARMQTDEIAPRALHFRSSGYRAQGRPRKRWLDCVSEVCKNNNTTISQTVQHAIHRHSIPRRFTAQVRR